MTAEAIWSLYRACPQCFAEAGQPCLSLSGFSADGDIAVEAPGPHSGRKLRTGAVA